MWKATACAVLLLLVWTQTAEATFRAKAVVTFSYHERFNAYVFFSSNNKALRIDFEQDGKSSPITQVYDLQKPQILETSRMGCAYQPLSVAEIPALFLLDSSHAIGTLEHRGKQCHLLEVVESSLHRRIHFIVTQDTGEVLKVTSEHLENGFEQSMEFFDIDTSDPGYIQQQIMAPAFEDACLLTPVVSKSICPEKCSSHGFCLAGQCHCYFGFAGTDCALTPQFVTPSIISKRDNGCFCDPRTCFTSVCAYDTCQYFSQPTGSPCSDGNKCTWGDTCSSTGQCNGKPLDCSSLDDQCQNGKCDPTSGTCEADYFPNDKPCYLPSDWEEANGVCRNGVCVDPNAALCGNGVIDVGTNEACDPGDPQTGSNGVCCPSCRSVVDEIGGCAPKAISNVYHKDCFVSYCRVPHGHCSYDFTDEGAFCGNGLGRCDGEGNCIVPK